MSTTPNMNLSLPTPGGDTDEWGEILNEALEAIDEHDHSIGKGTAIPAAGLNIDAALTLNSNHVEEVASVRMDRQDAVLATASDVNSVYVVEGDLYFNNGIGTPVQLTDGNSTVAPSSSDTPPGIVLPYAGLTAPLGYLMADGTAVSRSTYSALFAIIGTIYGTGDGTTTFNLPKMNGRVPVGGGLYIDNVSGPITRVVGDEMGAEKHILTEGELAEHTHIQNAHTHTEPYQFKSTIGAGEVYTMVSREEINYLPTPYTLGSTTAVNQNTGGDDAHNNMQPSLVLNYIIKT
jgi:microcystin-dependent protein